MIKPISQKRTETALLNTSFRKISQKKEREKKKKQKTGSAATLNFSFSFTFQLANDIL